MNRMQEISSNTSLIREMRMIASYNKLIEQSRMSGGKRMLMHVIEAEEFIRAFSWSSRLNAGWTSCSTFTTWVAPAPTSGLKPISVYWHPIDRGSLF